MTGRIYTAAELAAEARREVAMRRYVYCRKYADGNVTLTQQRQIEMMQQIADEYAEKAKAERLL